MCKGKITSLPPQDSNLEDGKKYCVRSVITLPPLHQVTPKDISALSVKTADNFSS